MPVGCVGRLGIISASSNIKTAPNARKLSPNVRWALANLSALSNIITAPNTPYNIEYYNSAQHTMQNSKYFLH